MGKSNLLLGISLDIDTFKAHLRRISKDGYKLHELDKDLLLQKTRELYDNILMLDVSGKEERIKEIIVEKVVVKPEPDTMEPEVQQSKPIYYEAKKFNDENKQDVFIEEKTTVIIEPPKEVEPPKEIEPPTVIVELPKEIELPKEVEQPKKTEQPIEIELAPGLGEEPKMDLFSTVQATVSDRFVGKDEKSLADKLQHSKLSDLRSAIGINEKFLFINELFGGDMGRYNKILDELNSMPGKTGLETYFMELKIEKQWNVEEEAFVKFKDLVDRKFV